MTFKDVSSYYNGKMLRSIVRVSDSEIIEVSLYFSDEYKQVVNKWGVKMREPLGTKVMRMNVSPMKSDGLVYTGGLGKTYDIKGGFKRQSIKELNVYAGTLTDETIIAMADGVKAEPTLLVGK